MPVRSTPVFAILLSLFVLFSFSPAYAQSEGRVKGSVKDDKNGELPGVTIKIEENNTGTVTQEDGTYEIVLPQGRYTVIFSYIGFEKKRVTDVVISRNTITDLNVVMQEGQKGTLSEVVVTSTYNKASVEGLYTRQKNSASISDGISADQIRKTPDNNAAQVLRRVSGLTIQDSKFVTVRGMSERYNNVMLNNSSLPSTEPNRRNFSFDILPSSLIDNIVVSKTATPDMPGEFAGGVVQVQTKDIPEENYIAVSLGSGYNTLSAGRPFQSLKRDRGEFLAKPGDNRNWWHNNWDDYEYKKYVNSGDYKNIAAYDHKIPNNWGLYEYKYNPVQQYQAVIGRVKKLKHNNTIGIIAAVTYRHDEYRTEEAKQFCISAYDLAGTLYDFNTTMAGILNASWQGKNHKISFRNLYNKKLGQSTEVISGNDIGNTSFINSYTDIVTLNTLYQNKLEGEHTITGKKIKIGWNVDRSQLIRMQPDMRNSISSKGNFALSETSGSFSLSSGGLSIMNARLKEVRYNYSFFVMIPFNLFGQEQKIKAGYQGTSRNADFIFDGFKLQYMPGSEISAAELYDRPDYFIGDPKYLTEKGLYYRPAGPSFSSDPEAYAGKQTLQAAYVMLDLRFNSWLRFIGGARMENNNVSVNTITYSFINNQNIIQNETREYQSTDILPSGNLVASLNAKMNVRAAYSRTLARPDFRERSAFAYYDFYEKTLYRGVNGLLDTKTDNVDLRYEYYPRAGEVLSFSLFYKKFINPVELVQQTSSGAPVNFYFNLASSTNYGVEADWRKSLGFLTGNSGFLKDIYVSGNASYMKSSVQYDINRLVKVASGVNPDSLEDSDKKRSRPLQGLSPYIINVGLGYQNNLFGAQVSYNRFGPRLLTGAPEQHEDQYEQTRNVLDLQLSARLVKKMDIRLNISDLLQEPFIVYQNAGVTTDGTQTIDDNGDPKGSNYNADKDVIRSKSFRGSNISISIGVQL